jgi:hypothetical protein
MLDPSQVLYFSRRVRSPWNGQCSRSHHRAGCVASSRTSYFQPRERQMAVSLSIAHLQQLTAHAFQITADTSLHPSSQLSWARGFLAIAFPAKPFLLRQHCTSRLQYTFLQVLSAINVLFRSFCALSIRYRSLYLVVLSEEGVGEHVPSCTQLREGAIPWSSADTSSRDALVAQLLPHVAPCAGTFSCPWLLPLATRYLGSARRKPQNIKTFSSIGCQHRPCFLDTPLSLIRTQTPIPFATYTQHPQPSMRLRTTLPAFLAATVNLVNGAPSRYVAPTDKAPHFTDVEQRAQQERRRLQLGQYESPRC